MKHSKKGLQNIFLDGNFRDGLVEAVEPRGRLDHAQLEIVDFLLAEVGVCVGLVERGGKVLGAAESRDGPVHLWKGIKIYFF